ncbi:gag/pol protein [Cucumis melo var. makuwa]|uniref:Gag/pol protein n=1 Tax=Cucumis melo var. makuwa TaxID=1194695 RepID=A0A5D3BYP1_CUCMM|nr:gag/pol protein [Cucumis melo var. makuwa]
MRDYMLVYGAKDLILTGYTDSDFQTDEDSRKSTSGLVFTLNGRAVVCRSIMQGCIADSIMEAEYVTTYEAAKEAVWLRKFLYDLEVVPNMNLPITTPLIPRQRLIIKSIYIRLWRLFEPISYTSSVQNVSSH